MQHFSLTGLCRNKLSDSLVNITTEVVLQQACVGMFVWMVIVTVCVCVHQIYSRQKARKGLCTKFPNRKIPFNTQRTNEHATYTQTSEYTHLPSPHLYTQHLYKVQRDVKSMYFITTEKERKDTAPLNTRIYIISGHKENLLTVSSSMVPQLGL